MKDTRMLNDKELEMIDGGKIETTKIESTVFCYCGCEVKLIDGYGVCENCGQVHDFRN